MDGLSTMTSNTAGDGTAVAMSVTAPGAPLTPQPVELSRPQRGWVRVTVTATGVCYADLGTAEGPKASEAAPVTPWHEDRRRPGVAGRGACQRRLVRRQLRLLRVLPHR